MYKILEIINLFLKSNDSNLWVKVAPLSAYMCRGIRRRQVSAAIGFTVLGLYVQVA
jgi:hypothetical protein